MSRGLNKVQIIGHLGRDPEMRYTPSGRPVTTFTVAVSRSWNTVDGERHNETEWFNIVAWGNLAEICKQYLNKGQQVYIEGRIPSTPPCECPAPSRLPTAPCSSPPLHVELRI